MAIETGDQPVASSRAVGTDVSQGSEEPEGRISEGARLGSAARRGRRSLWAILSLLFALGLAVSTVMVNSERNGALDNAVERARDEAQLVKANLTGEQLAKFTGRRLSEPVTGSSYDKLAAKLRRSVPSSGSIAGVTVWSSHGRILFSLNESRVGKTPPQMEPLITEAKASSLTRVVDDTVQTFTPVSKAADGPVAIVQVDRPLEVVETQTGDLWSMVRLGSALGLVVSLLFLGLTFVPSRRSGRARDHEERPERGERRDDDAGAKTNAEGQPKESPTEASAPSYEEVFGLQHELDQTVEQDGDLEGDPEALEGDPEAREAEPQAREPDPVALESIRRWDEAYEDEVHEELQTQELMRQRREEFKARAEAAALRVKKLEAEPHEAPPTPD